MRRAVLEALLCDLEKGVFECGFLGFVGIFGDHEEAKFRHGCFSRCCGVVGEVGMDCEMVLAMCLKIGLGLVRAGI